VSRRDPAWIAPDPEVRRRQIDRLPRSLTDPDPPGGFYRREGRTGLDHPIVSWEMEETHALGRRIGVSFRHPYWDADLVSFLCRMPPEWLNAGGRSKGLVRDSLARRFPDLGFESLRKVGAGRFYRRVLAEQGPPAAESVRDLPVLSALGVVEGAAATATLFDLLARGGPDVHRAWDLINLESWLSHHVT
jgi:hypothetical protein